MVIVMHLFQTPWLRNANRLSHPAARRIGNARRIALLLQEEAEKKPVLQLDAAPRAVLVDVTGHGAKPIAA